MAVTNSLPSCSICKTRKSFQSAPSPCNLCSRNRPHYVVCSLFLNWSSRSLKTNSSGGSSSLALEEDESTSSGPAMHQRMRDFSLSRSIHAVHGSQLDFKPPETDRNLPDDSKNLNDVIIGLFKDIQTQEIAYKYYEKAKRKPEFRPQRYTLRLVIRYLTQSKNWSSMPSVCEDLKIFRILPSKSTCCMLIATCIKARKFKLVDTLLDVFLAADVEIAVLAFDSAMKGYNQLHMYNSTVVVYQRLRSCEVALDTASCYCRVMEAHLKMGHYEKAIEIFQEIENRKLIKDSEPSSCSSQIYFILCESLGKTGRPFEALEFFRDMSKKGVPEDHSLYSSLISSFARVGEVKLAEELLGEAEEKKMLRDPALFLKLVLMYVDEGLLQKTLDVVATMKRVNLRVSDCIFCAIVNGFSKRRGLRAAIKVYGDLVSQCCDPGQVTYASIVNIYCRLGRYTEAELHFAEMEKKGFDMCVVAYTSMVAAYGKMGRVSDATKLVAKMKEKGCEPNVWTYNSLLEMHGKVSNLRAVEKVWKEMKRRRVPQDKVSYTSVISAYNRARELETCFKYYQEFRLTGGTVDRAMAGIMVAVLSKTNRIDELVELLQDMKMQGTKLDSRFYHSAMNALRDAGLQVQAKRLQESFHELERK